MHAQCRGGDGSLHSKALVVPSFLSPSHKSGSVLKKERWPAAKTGVAKGENRGGLKCYPVL